MRARKWREAGTHTFDTAEDRGPKGLILFPECVRLGERRLRLPERLRASALRPGMLAHVEITTGSRTVMAYLLSPIAKATSEAGRGW